MDITPAGTKVLVSSTAPGTSRRSLLREDDEAWTASSVPAWISLSFPVEENTSLKVQKLALTFQGGFVSTSINVVATIASEEGSKEVEVVLGKVFPEDVNKRQVLELPTPAENVTGLRLEMPASSDHHGRVTLYRLELLD